MVFWIKYLSLRNKTESKNVNSIFFSNNKNIKFEAFLGNVVEFLKRSMAIVWFIVDYFNSYLNVKNTEKLNI